MSANKRISLQIYKQALLSITRNFPDSGAANVASLAISNVLSMELIDTPHESFPDLSAFKDSLS